MNKKHIIYIKLFAAICVFMLSIFSYNTASSFSGNECLMCNKSSSSSGWCSEATEAGWTGCSESGSDCSSFGEMCGCDPTEVCEA